MEIWLISIQMAQNELQVRGKTAYLSSVMEKRSQKGGIWARRWRTKDRMQENSRRFRGGHCETGSDWNSCFHRSSWMWSLYPASHFWATSVVSFQAGFLWSIYLLSFPGLSGSVAPYSLFGTPAVSLIAINFSLVPDLWLSAGKSLSRITWQSFSWICGL